MLLYDSLFNLSSLHARFLRSAFLRRKIIFLQKSMNLIGYPAPLLVGRSDVYVYADGVFLNTKFTNRYTKVIDGHLNEGYQMGEYLKSVNVEPRSMLDIGANCGEISLYFAKTFPECIVVAIEPSTENFNNLKSNLDFNIKMLGETTFKNLSLFQVAVSNNEEPVELTKYFRGENTIILDESHMRYRVAATETVKSTTIDKIASSNGFKNVDFVKIDIEGAEPLLTEGLIKIKPKVILLEFSNKNKKEKYLDMFKKLINQGYKPSLVNDGHVANYDGKKIDSLLEDLNNNRHWGTLFGGGDVWFVK